MKDKRANPKNYAMITISEGAKMIQGRDVSLRRIRRIRPQKLGGIGEETGPLLKKLTGEDVLIQRLSYLMRSGMPDSLDLMVAVNYANMAIDLFLRQVLRPPGRPQPGHLHGHPPQHRHHRPEEGGCERTL